MSTRKPVAIQYTLRYPWHCDILFTLIPAASWHSLSHFEEQNISEQIVHIWCILSIHWLQQDRFFVEQSNQCLETNSNKRINFYISDSDIIHCLKLRFLETISNKQSLIESSATGRWTKIRSCWHRTSAWTGFHFGSSRLPGNALWENCMISCERTVDQEKKFILLIIQFAHLNTLRDADEEKQ